MNASKLTHDELPPRLAFPDFKKTQTEVWPMYSEFLKRSDVVAYPLTSGLTLKQLKRLGELLKNFSHATVCSHNIAYDPAAGCLELHMDDAGPHYHATMRNLENFINGFACGANEKL